MPKQRSSMEEQLLAEQLRREAADSRPEFSESLHCRIVAAVRQHHAAVADVVHRAAFSRPWVRGLAAALAATCLLAVAAIGWRLMVNASRQETIANKPSAPAPLLADLPSMHELPGQAMGRLDHLSVATFEPQATRLKHDARSVAGLFLDRLPVSTTLASSRQPAGNP
jgi:hypothetical protein